LQGASRKVGDFLAIVYISTIGRLDYLFSWRENTKQCSKTFPATEQGLAKAIKYRAKVYKRIGNQNGKRLI